MRAALLAGVSAVLLGGVTVPASAQDYTPQATLQRLFEVEGDTPYPAPYAGTLNFSAYSSKYDSGHGHGYRNELKIADKQRRPAAQTVEHFAARVTPTLPAGAKTIIAQYHVVGLDTILKVYVQDSAERKGLDGKAGNGVFDILVRILGSDGKQATSALGTVRSGEGFDLDITFRAGLAQVSARTAAGQRQSPATRVQADGRAIYFKFGDYLQARDPDGGEHTTDPAKWERYYRAQHIDASRISFSHTVFERGHQD